MFVPILIETFRDLDNGVAAEVVFTAADASRPWIIRLIDTDAGEVLPVVQRWPNYAGAAASACRCVA